MHSDGMASNVVRIEVPPGCGAGDEVEVEGRIVRLPPGSVAGMLLDVELPNAQQEVELTVPEGLLPGDVLVAEFDGGSYEVTVPPGCGSGDRITVSIPTAAPIPEQQQPEQQLSPPSPPPAEAVPAAAPPAPEAPSAYRIGQRVQVMRSNGEWCTAFIDSYDAPSDLFRVELFEQGSGVFKEGVTEADLGSTYMQLSIRPSARRPYDSSSDESSSDEESGGGSAVGGWSSTGSGAASDASDHGDGAVRACNWRMIGGGGCMVAPT